MTESKLLGIKMQPASKSEVLEHIKKYTSSRRDFCHVVSLNPENMVTAYRDREFKEVVETAQIHIADGVGVVAAGQMLGIHGWTRLTGVDLMKELIAVVMRDSLSVLLIGGNGNLAKDLADCYNQSYHTANFYGLEGFKNIQNPTKEEKETLFSIVAARRPHLIFVSFGSPWQEKWIYKNRALLQGAVCIGVGGAFNYLSGKVLRPPVWVRRLGFEWFFRLLTQPWRWKRQLKLLTFIRLVLLQRLGLLPNA